MILTVGNVSSEDYDIYIFGVSTYNAPVRDMEKVSVAGRNGDLLFDNGRYENIEVEYHGVSTSEFGTRFDEYRSALLAQIGYQRIEDDDHPDEFRLGWLSSTVEAEPKGLASSGSFDLSFDCKPQRFLKSGEIVTTLTANGSIENPTAHPSKPLLRVYGYGQLTIGSVIVTIAQHSLTYIDIDCDTMDAFKGATNANSYLTLNSGVFPTLQSGTNNITKASTISRVEITPRWWNL